MNIETGDFSKTNVTGYAIDGNAFARVVIPVEDFKRLQLGSWEKYDRTSPCMLWCYEHVGHCLSKWKMIGDSMRSEKKEIFYFTDYKDALMFVLRWAS